MFAATLAASDRPAMPEGGATLDQLLEGGRARVLRVEAPPSQLDWARQLQDRGFVPGAEAQCVQIEPLRA